MKKRIQKYLSGDKEGFSLVELIIVIAIMAILIAVVALAVIPYLEKSRVGKDQQAIDTVYNAFQSCVADQKITKDLTVEIPNGAAATATVSAGETATSATVLKFMADALGGTGAGDIHSTTSDKLESADAKGEKIVCKYIAATKVMVVYAAGTKGKDTEIFSCNQAKTAISAAEATS